MNKLLPQRGQPLVKPKFKKTQYLIQAAYVKTDAFTYANSLEIV